MCTSLRWTLNQTAFRALFTPYLWQARTFVNTVIWRVLASFWRVLASSISIYAKFARLLQVSGEPSFSRKISARICGEQKSENAYWTPKSWQLEINNLATWFSYMFVELHLKKITKKEWAPIKQISLANGACIKQLRWVVKCLLV